MKKNFMKTWEVFSIKKRNKFFIIALLVATMVFCSGCGKNADSKPKDNLDKANGKVSELDAGDEKKKELSFRMGSEGAIVTKYEGEAEDLEIPKVYEGEPVVEIAPNAFKGCNTIKSLTIPPSVKKIGSNVLDEATGIIIRGYDNTAAQFLTYSISGLTFESMGANKQKARSVKIWDTEGAHYTTLWIGEKSNAENIQGVSFEEKDGESVLRLENASIGTLEVDEYASLVIELAEGSVNHIEGLRGRNGIISNGAVTVIGAGSLYVKGSDYYSAQGTGYGIYVVGDLTIENAAAVSVKAGTGKDTVNIGVYVFCGNLIVSDAKLEALAEGSKSTAPGVLVESFFGREGDDGKILLEKASVTGGGDIVPYIAVFYDGMTGETEKRESGSCISSGESVTWTGRMLIWVHQVMW